MPQELKAHPGTPETGAQITRKVAREVEHKGKLYKPGDEITDRADYIQRLEGIGVLEPLPQGK